MGRSHIIRKASNLISVDLCSSAGTSSFGFLAYRIRLTQKGLKLVWGSLRNRRSINDR